MNRQEQEYKQLLHNFEWEYKNKRGAEISLSQDKVYLVDDLRAVQDKENFSNKTRMKWKQKKYIPWPLILEEIIEALKEENDHKYKDIEELSDMKQKDVVMDEFIKWLKDDQKEISKPQDINISTEGIGVEKDEQAINIDMPIYILVFLFTKLTSRRCQKLVFVRKTQCFKNEFFLYNYSTLNDHIAAQELNLKEAVYWVYFCGYPLIANDTNKLVILQNQMQDKVQQSEAQQLMTLQTGINFGCKQKLVNDNGVLIVPVEIELD
ncbi:1385_t:CDS:2 [Dentiscutata erythropus]|uniref:1385_t:CDS:1 n=1 Tax=Dentiscutata erythropus TaxID=1348616 RepID=A0A9N9J7U7_9GLOM|nr:1385_t:CDS:2 [Dentiscutata erythropus]